MILIDLFCGAGGASEGYARAGFKVWGVDKTFTLNYPYNFIQADVFDLDLDFLMQADLIHASPPCQAYSVLRHTRPDMKWETLIEPTRELLKATGKDYVIENVPGAPLESPLMLCGSMFGLGVIRHRLFECSFSVEQPKCKQHPKAVRVYGDNFRIKEAQEAMGIDWMTRREMSQAIPPSYTEYIGKQFI